MVESCAASLRGGSGAAVWSRSPLHLVTAGRVTAPAVVELLDRHRLSGATRTPRADRVDVPGARHAAQWTHPDTVAALCAGEDA